MLALAFACGPVLAAGDPPAETRDPVIEKATAATKRQDWASAADVLKGGLATDPNNASYHNLYAYSLRKSANPDMNLVFKHYNEALRIDPKHRGAHEYIGEAYLMIGDVPNAEKHVAALRAICLLPCEELAELETAVARYRAMAKQ